MIKVLLFSIIFDVEFENPRTFLAFDAWIVRTLVYSRIQSDGLIVTDPKNVRPRKFQIEGNDVCRLQNLFNPLFSVESGVIRTNRLGEVGRVKKNSICSFTLRVNSP